MRCDLQFGDEKDVPNWSVCLFFSLLLQSSSPWRIAIRGTSNCVVMKELRFLTDDARNFTLLILQFSNMFNIPPQSKLSVVKESAPLKTMPNWERMGDLRILQLNRWHVLCSSNLLETLSSAHFFQGWQNH